MSQRGPHLHSQTDAVSMDISSPLSIPRLAWGFYVDYLWNWTDHPGSWISRIAYISRIFAILLILPVVVLTLLDIASYGIARTLGIIDEVKASTSDKETIHNQVPLVRIYEPTPAPAPCMATDSDLQSECSSTDTLPPLRAWNPPAYFTSEENSLKLSGVGVFSPAASRPPSPTLTRRTLPYEDEAITFRKRATASKE
ncbi:hypothetical protein GGX14DRAFT_438600 [Mycena pura]|uniref:Uncharacterized protein n=1 Tax=Mycena pura TaxID=153505 RepID=A0AAD6VRH1_9AGAR|nr:hypothetical protein GGX14DRAFT_438600 [Mycena pura]